MKHLFSILTTLFLVLVFFVSCGGSEPGSIYGVVTDKATGEPIINAGVELHLLESETIVARTATGSDGYFATPEISEGEYDLLVTKTGYIENRKTVHVKSAKQTPYNVQLEKEPAALRIVDDAKNDISELDFGDKFDDVSRSFNIFNDSPNSFEWKITKTAEWITSISQVSGKLAAGDTQGIIVEIDRSLLREEENLSRLHITAINNGDKRLTIKATDLDPCLPNPCSDKENSTGICNIIDAKTYSCECKDTFTWNGSKCLNPCDPNPCIGVEHSTEVCKKLDDFTEYSCGCDSNYEWKNSACVGKKRTYTCTELSENAVWNSVSSYTQTWDGTDWFPPDSSAAYNEVASETECRFKCDTNYNWNSSTSTCDAAKQTVNCSPKPANTVWNTVSTVTQTWNGSTWSPSNTSTYNTTASTSECRYKCVDTYFWYNSECINPCDYEPCKDVANSTKVCKASSWNNYSCSCNQNFEWNGSQCTIPECRPNLTVSCEDSSTGLMWSTKPSNKMTWEDAQTYCNNLTERSFANWRLPTIDDLRTLIQNCNYTETGGDCMITNDCSVFVDCHSDLCTSCSEDSSGGLSKLGDTDAFWSSSKYVYGGSLKFPCFICHTGGIWVVNFLRGSVVGSFIETNGEAVTLNVRCVR